MTALSTKHLLTGNELTKDDINALLSLAIKVKQQPSLYSDSLMGESVALIFEKPSLRTRFSFSAGINQLGGQAIESMSHTRKSEEPEDFIRVIQGYCTAMMIRTFDDESLQIMKDYATVPIINGLTDKYHPCQILADLLTLKETFNTVSDLTISYIGDGNNILHSLLLMATKLGIIVHYCCPPGHYPDKTVLNMIENNQLVESFSDPKQAVNQCHAVYTDVWTSMGFEQKNETDFAGYQVNEALMSYANDNAIFMHCMPMERGKEVSHTLPDALCSSVFIQSENRMHVQKALLLMLLKPKFRSPV